LQILQLQAYNQIQFELNFRPMKFTQISKIDLNIVLFEVLDSVEKEKLYSIVFENTSISFLDTEWKGFLKKENELFLFGKIKEKIYRVRLYCNQEKELITGELYQKIYKKEYELVALLKIVEIHNSEGKSFDFEIDEQWIFDCLYDMNLISEKDTYSNSGNIENFLENLGISTNYSKKFIEEGIDIENIKYITDDEINLIFDKIGDRLKMRNFIKSVL
jgi:hypothetical protein